MDIIEQHGVSIRLFFESKSTVPCEPINSGLLRQPAVDATIHNILQPMLCRSPFNGRCEAVLEIRFRFKSRLPALSSAGYRRTREDETGRWKLFFTLHKQ